MWSVFAFELTANMLDVAGKFCWDSSSDIRSELSSMQSISNGAAFELRRIIRDSVRQSRSHGVKEKDEIARLAAMKINPYTLGNFDNNYAVIRRALDESN
jgi:hypothetical protein